MVVSDCMSDCTGYIVQVTGAHNQFYEKFHYRHYMAQLLLYVCQFPVYLKAVEKVPLPLLLKALYPTA